MANNNNNVMVFGITILLLSAVVSIGGTNTMESDEKECAEEMASLAACIPYVSGEAKKPVPQCCDETRKVKESKPKCLCVLIKESSDPSMGLPVNTTLALQMPSVCNIDAKVSDCPSLLKLPPNSPDEKIFKDADSDSTTSTTSTDSSNTPVSTSSSSSSKPDSNPASNNEQKSKSIDTFTLLMMLLMGSMLFLFP